MFKFIVYFEIYTIRIRGGPIAYPYEQTVGTNTAHCEPCQQPSYVLGCLTQPLVNEMAVHIMITKLIKNLAEALPGQN